MEAWDGDSTTATESFRATQSSKSLSFPSLNPAKDAPKQNRSRKESRDGMLSKCLHNCKKVASNRKRNEKGQFVKEEKNKESGRPRGNKEKGGTQEAGSRVLTRSPFPFRRSKNITVRKRGKDGRFEKNGKPMASGYPTAVKDDHMKVLESGPEAGGEERPNAEKRTSTEIRNSGDGKSCRHSSLDQRANTTLNTAAEIPTPDLKAPPLSPPSRGILQGGKPDGEVPPLSLPESRESVIDCPCPEISDGCKLSDLRTGAGHCFFCLARFGMNQTEEMKCTISSPNDSDVELEDPGSFEDINSLREGGWTSHEF